MPQSFNIPSVWIFYQTIVKIWVIFHALIEFAADITGRLHDLSEDWINYDWSIAFMSFENLKTCSDRSSKGRNNYQINIDILHLLAAAFTLFKPSGCNVTVFIFGIKFHLKVFFCFEIILFSF